MYLHDLATGERKVEFPLDVGSIGSVTGRKEDKEIFYSFTSFLTPGRIYRCDLSGNDINPMVSQHITTVEVVFSVFLVSYCCCNCYKYRC